MVVSEGAISNIMGGMENTAGVRLHSHRHKLKQRFDILRKLGQGTYGKVQLAVNKDTGQEVAIKTIKKAKIETEQDLVRIRREIQIMSSVQHPQIIHIYEVFENREKMVLVMEYAAGGELYDYLSERKVLSVEEARRVFRQVASAVYYCHKHKICHRDLKLENILLDIEGNAKIADFGLSNVFEDKRRLDTFCGSPLYASPEIVKGVPYVGPEVDCWSLGVLLYTLVYGAMPFDGSNFKRLVKQITQGDFYEPPAPSSASPLIRGMLAVTAEKRANIADICNHWWVNDGEARSCLDEAEELANQTPVRLDLLLSLAPKEISSEHMVIQPDEEENSQRSDEGQPVDTYNQTPSAAPSNRSLSMGALEGATAALPDAIAPFMPTTETSKGETNEGDATVKKRKDISTDKVVGEEKKKVKKKSSTSSCEEKPKKKTSVKKKEASVESSPMDVEVNKNSSVDDGIPGSSVKSVKKKVVKKKSTSKEREDKKSIKEPEAKESSVTRSRESTPKANVVENDRPNQTHRAKGLTSPSNKSILSVISADGTLKASDSSIANRQSVSPAKTVEEVKVLKSSISSKTDDTNDTSSSQTGETKPKQINKTLRNNSVTKVGKAESVSKVSKNSSVNKLSNSSSVSNDTNSPASTDEVLKETVAKMKKDDSKKDESSSIVNKKTSSDNSKESSQQSSLVSTPARSRTGSESSNDNKGSRRGSKVFSKAAMWDTMCNNNTEKPPVSSEKGRKGPRLNMSDLTKKFEEKPPPDRKRPIVGAVKISDVKKSFENKSSEKVGLGMRRQSSANSGDSISSRRDSSAPISPSRSVKEDSLPPPGKFTKKSLEQPSEQDIPIWQENTTEKTKRSSPAKEKSPIKSTVKSSKESDKKEKSPDLVESKNLTRPGMKRDITTPKRSSPVKDSKRTTSNLVKRVPSSSNTAKKETVSAEDKCKTAETKRNKSKHDMSDSSESESEAEKLLRQVSERRERVEAAKQEKLRKVSKQSEDKPRPRINRPCLNTQADEQKNITDNTTQVVETPDVVSDKPVDIPSASINDAEQPSSHKQATLSKIVKNKGEAKTKPDHHEPLMKQITAVSPEEVLGSLHGDTETRQRKKSEIEINLTPSASGSLLSDDRNRASYAEIKLATPSKEFKTEVRHNITPSLRPRQTPSATRVNRPDTSTPKPPPTSHADSSLQRAPRERIIPIMMEGGEDTEEDRRTSSSASSSSSRLHRPMPFEGDSSTSSPFLHSPLFKGGKVGPLGGVFSSPPAGLSGIGSGISSTASPEPIRKSRRERIIPISFEGEVPVNSPISANNHGTHSDYQPRPDSMSSADDSADEDENDEDEDGFHSLTAESLFSTLLNRVRNLTKNRRMVPMHHQMMGGIGGGFSPFSSIHSPSLRHQDPFGDNGKFWSSLYSPPRELSRQGSEASAVGTGGDNRSSSSIRGTHQPTWGSTLSRDLSQDSNASSGAVYSQGSSAGATDTNSPYNTLPRAPSSRIIIINQEEDDEDDNRTPEKSHSGQYLNNKNRTNQRHRVSHEKFFGGDP